MVDQFSNKIEDQYFDASHLLVGHSGKCRNMHGHTWKIKIIVAGNELDEIGMLVDFSILKKKLKNVLKEFDHSVILWDCDENNERITHHIKMEDKLVLLKYNPTAEYLSKYIYEKIGSIEGTPKIVKILVQESVPKGGTAGYNQYKIKR